jgi:protein TonB
VSEAEPVVKETVPQVAVATHPAPSIKVDHGWLADSLRRRLAELKRYPSTARLNGWEGKVVLRAVIRADGHLAEVKVHRSSGYDALDNAAIEAIRLVCPLHMHQPLGTSEVAVYVPIVYSLAG